MQHNEISKREKEAVAHSLGSHGLERNKPLLVVPLSAVSLDIPFEAATQEGNQKVEALPEAILTPKSGRAGRLESTDQATAGLTLPLKAKLWLVFGGFTVLLLIVFALTGWIFFRVTSLSQGAVNQQLRSDRAHHLQMAFLGQQGAISRILLETQSGKPVSDFEFTLYNITFENNLFLLKEEQQPASVSLRDLEERQDNLTTRYWKIFRDLEAKDFDKALVHWQESEVWTQDLIARLFSFSWQQDQLAQTRKKELEKVQTESWIMLGGVAGGGLILLAILIWLANHFVINPMGRLNVKLGQLLYSQTARITARLNLLEHEINNQEQKVAATRHDLKLPLSNIRNAAELPLICQPDLPGEVQTSLQEIIDTSDWSAQLINSLLARSDNRLDLQKADLVALVQRVVELVDLRDYKVHLRVELFEAVLDLDLIEHALLNLLSNARKFSAGGITVGTRLVPYQWGVDPNRKSGEDEVELWVWNDGPVITPHERDIIFRPGGQAPIGRQSGGHGLGLAIVKSVVERHGGRVTVESHEKVGTTFRVFLPYLPEPLNTEVGE